MGTERCSIKKTALGVPLTALLSVMSVVAVAQESATIDVSLAILLLAALSVLGVGAQPPLPEWGAMVTIGRKYLLDYPWYATFPGLAIFAAVLSFNVLGERVRDVLDPQSRLGERH